MLLEREPQDAVITPSATWIASENFAPVTPMQIADTSNSFGAQAVGQPSDEQVGELTARIGGTAGTATGAAATVSGAAVGAASLRVDAANTRKTAMTADNRIIDEDRISTSIPVQLVTAYYK
jgi:hypothetical protein